MNNEILDYEITVPHKSTAVLYFFVNLIKYLIYLGTRLCYISLVEYII